MLEHPHSLEHGSSSPEYSKLPLGIIRMVNKDGREERVYHPIFVSDVRREKYPRDAVVSWTVDGVTGAAKARGTFEEYLKSMEIPYPFYEKSRVKDPAVALEALIYELHHQRLERLYRVASENYRRIDTSGERGEDVESREGVDRTFQSIFQEASTFEVIPTTWVDDNVFSVDTFLRVEDPDEPDSFLYFGIDTTLNKEGYNQKLAKIERSGPVTYLPTHPEMGKVIRLALLEEKEDYYANADDPQREESYSDRLRQKALDDLQKKGKQVREISKSEIEKRMSRLGIASVFPGGAVLVYERLIEIQNKIKSELLRYCTLTSYIESSDQEIIKKALKALEQTIELASAELDEVRRRQ